MDKKKEYSRTFWVNPYLALFVLLGWIFTIAVAFFPMIKFYVQELLKIGEWSTIVKTDEFKCLVFIAALLLAWIIALYIPSEQYFGVLSIKEYCIVFRSPLKRRRIIPYDEIQDIGIDVGTTGAFWIYISRKPIPIKYHHRINRMPPRKCDILFGYSDRAYHSLCTFLPKNISKKFSATASILMIYKNKR